jgi:hypothetical protein
MNDQSEVGSSAKVRAAIKQLVERHRISLAALSRAVGRNDAYLHQFLTRGTPERLPEDVRLRLARFFNVDERLLGARDPWTPPQLPADR